ncbi:hypothetical protein [Nguyenibacter sp. L1]|uniref:hypothetical protein n=1 Tax=Nguyenibacter sp. L1 TaxID=3049350 RepID=UPI002B4897E7|nr:hypothetical protein [Nguyenibacter sp. L1]WRH87584.1 hypothetical protein QN315_16695 [Nguyenibacter sp. L1]
MIAYSGWIGGPLGGLLLALHLALMLALAPLLRGAIDAGAARLGGAAPPPVLLRWRLILAQARRQGLRAAGGDLPPGLALAAALAACALVPSFALGLPSAGLSDLLALVTLLGAARLAALLPGLAAGVAASGRQAVGGIVALALAQTVFPLLLAVAMLATGSTTLDAMLTRLHDPELAGSRTPLVLAALSLLLAGSDAPAPGSPPFGLSPNPGPNPGPNPAPDPPADAGGRDRAALDLASDLSLLAWLTLAGDLAWPAALALPGEVLGGVPAALPGAILAWLARTALLAGALVAARALVLAPDRAARARLLLALLLALLAVVVLFAGRDFG